MEYKSLIKKTRVERKTEKKLNKYFADTQRDVLKKLKLEMKSSETDIVNAVLQVVMFEIMEDIIIDGTETSLLLGASTVIKKNKLGKIGINFNLQNPLAIKYIEDKKILSIPKINETTKNELNDLLLNGLKNKKTYNELAKEISDSFCFSPVRAKMIAVHEIGDAYGYGNYVPMVDTKAEGYKVNKKWLTVGDDKVTPTHTQNQSDGWIELDKLFSGTGDQYAPASDHPNCRCDTLYEIKK